jgi:hypothetical protein
VNKNIGSSLLGLEEIERILKDAAANLLESSKTSRVEKIGDK